MLGRLSDETVDLGLAAGQRDDEAAQRPLQHLAVAVRDQADQRVEPALGGAELHEREFAFVVAAAGHVGHGHHVDQLLQLAHDLVDHRIVAGGDQRKP